MGDIGRPRGTLTLEGKQPDTTPHFQADSSAQCESPSTVISRSEFGFACNGLVDTGVFPFRGFRPNGDQSLAARFKFWFPGP